MHQGNDSAKPAATRPQVPYVCVLESDNLAECPTDQYHLIQIQADLEYSRDHKGGSVVKLPVLLRFCPVCKIWYIDRLRLASLARQGVDLRCIDIVGSPSYPRPAAYEQWHPLPVRQEPAPPVPVKSKSGAGSGTAKVSKTVGTGKTTGSKTASLAKAKPAELNLAVRCLYCDGGQNGRMPGYRGVCSQDIYFGNIARDESSWCASASNRCREIRIDQLPEGEGLCMECRMLLDWQITLPDRPTVSHVGGIALATSVMPRESEANRRVIAAFLISSQDSDSTGTRLVADSRLRFDLAADEPVYFWKTIAGKGQPDEAEWPGNRRPVSQSALVRILHRAARSIKDPDRRAIAERLFEQASARYSPAQMEKLLS